MKQHFIQVQSYQTKNREHAEAQQFVEQYDNCLIDDSKLQEFKNKLEWAIVQINKKYPRCQDIRSSATSFTDGHQSISIEGNFHMSITEVKRYELSVPECKHHYTDYDGTSEHARCKSCGERVKVNGWKEVVK